MTSMSMSAVDSAESRKRQLLEETESKITLLENAILQVNSVKHQLYRNASEVKLQIHSQISPHLEALRSRELSLLNQVDLVLSSKEEILQQQQTQLSKNVGELQRSLEYSEDDRSLDGKLSESLERLDMVGLKPRETPYITFRPVPVGLKDVLLNFGKIDSNESLLKSAFVEPWNPSTSLPKHFEDYGDADHHVLYKTVEEISQARTSDNSIYVNIPRLSLNTGDWLVKPSLTTTTTTTTAAETRPRFSFPPFNKGTSEWLSKRSECDGDSAAASTSLPQILANASIQDWLHQIKQNPDGEEEEDDDDFEMLDNGLNSESESSDSIEIVSASSLSGFVSSPPTGVFKKILRSTMKHWLSPQASADSMPAAKLSYFTKVSNDDDSNWLTHANYTRNENSSNSCSAIKNSCDIENLGSGACVEDAMKNFRNLSVDTKNWFKNGKPFCALPPVTSVCKANEICQTYSECVCQPNCGQQSCSKNINDEKWLMSEKAVPWYCPVSFPPFETMKASVWLSCCKDDCKLTPEVEKYNSDDCKTASVIGDNWLLGSQPAINKNKPSLTKSSFVSKLIDDTQFWLAKSSGIGIFSCKLGERADSPEELQEKADTEKLKENNTEVGTDADAIEWLLKSGKVFPSYKHFQFTPFSQKKELSEWLVCKE